ncbi:MAG: YicC family protein [Bacteroidales bacterium]|jgi:uncharacterized protein (TIGR00255 family)|nr:YicC family protein [Bacteroidales bacterium]
MIKSMTGFGSATYNFENWTIKADLRSINSKLFDLYQKNADFLKDKELEIRNLLLDNLERGKIDLNISMEKENLSAVLEIDFQKANNYYHQWRAIADKMGMRVKDKDIFASLLKLSDIYLTPQEFLEDNHLWEAIKKTIQNACNELNISRESEGKFIKNDFILRIDKIISLLDEIEQFEPQRIDTLKTRIEKQLQEWSGDYDKNRMEQEIIYYLEKIDFSEEKIRLQKHCQFFKETMEEAVSNGKKLAFISQEIGREINTLGSKAYDAQIQKKVVQMKDELEKIKEQLANVL